MLQLISLLISFSTQIKMDTAPKPVKKVPRKQKRSKKLHQIYMQNLKEVELKDNNLSTSFPTDKSIPLTSSSSYKSITRSDDMYRDMVLVHLLC